MKTSMIVPVLLVAACSSQAGSPTAPDAAGGANCGNGVVDPGETCDDGNNANLFDGCLPGCQAVEPLTPPALTWTYYEIPGTKCIDGSPAGFSVNTSPGATKLLVYLEGGGACFNSFCDSIFTPSGHTPSATGIFDRSNAANPVADWDFVYVPYCSGDIYAGDKDISVGGKMRTFHGYSNFTAFLERWVPSFTGLDQVVLSGSSAGGFGAFSNFSQTQRAFGATPVTLIDDSAPAMTSQVFPPCLQTIFQDTWGLDGTVLADCGSDCSDPSDYVRAYLDHVLTAFPNARGGLFSSMQDQTIRTFAGYGWYGGWNMCQDYPMVVAGQVYSDGLTELRDHLVQRGAGISTMYVPGTGHTILRSAGFYTSTIGAGTTPAQWVATTIAGTTTQVGP